MCPTVEGVYEVKHRIYIDCTYTSTYSRTVGKHTRHGVFAQQLQSTPCLMHVQYRTTITRYDHALTVYTVYTVMASAPYDQNRLSSLSSAP